MGMREPAEIGMPLEEVDTPSLLIEMDAFERNLKRMASAAAEASVRLRPHAKTHKCAVIAQHQIELGAVGVCCQKVSEAETMVYGGVRDVLVTNEVVGSRKIARLVALAKEARVAVCADDPTNVADLNAAAVRFGVRLPVLVETNVGANRCGVEPGAPTLVLARQIHGSPGLRFAGIHAYHGSAQHLRSFDERRDAIERACGWLRETLDLLHRDGIPCDVVTGAGTGTYAFEAASEVFTEIQPGSYIFMDVDYGRNLGADGKPVHEFEHALLVYTTVMSRPTRDRAVVDAGLKAVSIDSGLPLIHGIAGVEYQRASDEHGKVQLTDLEVPLRVGTKLRLVPGHCDPTVNMYDWYVGVRNSRVEALWPIVARGALL
ncbi:MAG TPA: DSD1 family PLP-dependent enzyme [bacterium]|nr:DSD1 family PLP-dependent enzyme [bacterium]